MGFGTIALMIGAAGGATAVVFGILNAINVKELKELGVLPK